jgi:hypothetical protein
VERIVAPHGSETIEVRFELLAPIKSERAFPPQRSMDHHLPSIPNVPPLEITGKQVWLSGEI